MANFTSLISSYKKQDAERCTTNSSQLSIGTIEAALATGAGGASDDGCIWSEDGAIICFSHKQLAFLPHKVQLSTIPREELILVEPSASWLSE